MKTIIVATDFSKASQNAIDYAVEIALQVNARLILFNAYQMPVAVSEMPIVYDTEALIEDINKQLNTIKDKIQQQKGSRLLLQTEVSEGSLIGCLKDICEDMEPYAVVMGSQGTTAAERFFFGSNTLYALKHLHWPILAVPPQYTFKGIGKVAFASDLNKDVGKTALAILKDWVTDFNAELHIVHSAPEDQLYENAVFASGAMQKEFNLLKPRFHFISGKNVEESISQFVVQEQMDVLVLLHKSYGFIEGLFHKSQARHFALNTAIPLLVLHE